MRTHSKLVLAALAATMLLAIGVSGATARNLSTNERNFEFIWNEALGAPKTKLELIDRTDGLNVQCRVTVLGRFNERTIKKETALDQGTANHGVLEGCTGGTATIDTETFPWGVRYLRFSGTLPRIRSLLDALVGATIEIREPNGIQCKAASEVNHPVEVIAGNSAETAESGFETTGEPEDITAERGARIPLRGEFLCGLAGEGEWGGIGLLQNLPRTALLKITLI